MNDDNNISYELDDSLEENMDKIWLSTEAIIHRKPIATNKELLEKTRRR